MTEELDAGPIIEQMVNIKHFIVSFWAYFSCFVTNDNMDLNCLKVTMIIN